MPKSLTHTALQHKHTLTPTIFFTHCSLARASSRARSLSRNIYVAYAQTHCEPEWLHFHR